MPTAPGFDAKSIYFAIVDSDGSTTRDLSKYITSVDGLPGENELQDTTKVTDSGHTFTRTLWNAAFTVSGIYDKVTDSGAADVFQNLISMTTATSFEAGIAGNSTVAPTDQRYAGNVWLRGYNTPGQVGSVISFTANFQSNGVISISSGADWNN